MLGLDVGNRRHDANIPEDLPGGQMIWVVVMQGIVRDNHIRARLADKINIAESRGFIVVEELIRVTQPVKLGSDDCSRGDPTSPLVEIAINTRSPRAAYLAREPAQRISRSSG